MVAGVTGGDRRAPSWGEGTQFVIMGNYLLLARNHDSGVGSFPGGPYGIMETGASPMAAGAAWSTLAEYQVNFGGQGDPYHCRRCPAAGQCPAASTSSRIGHGRDSLATHMEAAWRAEAGGRDWRWVAITSPTRWTPTQSGTCGKRATSPERGKQRKVGFLPHPGDWKTRALRGWKLTLCQCYRLLRRQALPVLAAP